MKKKWKMYGKNPFFIGCVLLGMLMIEIIIYTCKFADDNGVEYIVSDEMVRESTIDAYTNPILLAKYILTAYLDDDMDKMLRGCAIEERAKGVVASDMIEYAGKFSIRNTYPPSGDYVEYQPIVQTRILKEYLVQYEKFQTVLRKCSKTEILYVDYFNEKEQLRTEKLHKMYKESEAWGAERIVDIIALLNLDGNYYITGLRMINYNGIWKLYSNTLEMIDAGKKNAVLTKCIQPADYKTLVVKADYFWLVQEGDFTIESQVAFSDALLPLNYTLYKQSYGETPECVIENFINCIRKKKVDEAISYGKVENFDKIGQEIHNRQIFNLVNKQDKFAEQILRLYYNILYRDVTEEFTLDSVGLTGKAIVKWLSPVSLYQIQYNGCELKHENENLNREYVVYLKFRGEDIAFGMTLEEVSNGWIISQLAAEKVGVGIGEVR